MLRSHNTRQYDDELDDDDDDDDERHSSIELKDILNRKLPTPTTSDDEDEADTDTTDGRPLATTTHDDSTSSSSNAAVADDNHIGRLTPNYSKTHRHRTAIPRKTAALALFLTVVGIGFLCTGLSFLLTAEGGSLSESIPFIVLGGLSFIPGSFHVVILYLAYTNQYGWTYDHIPTYERQ